MNKDDAQNGALACLSEVVELLKEEGEARAGEVEGLIAYAALTRIKSVANTFGVPLADIGLAGYDIDKHLLNPPKKAA